MPFFKVEFHFGVSPVGKSWIRSQYAANIKYEAESHNYWKLIVEAPNQAAVDTVKSDLLNNLIQSTSLGDSWDSNMI